MEIAINMRQRVGSSMGNGYGTSRMMVVMIKLSGRMENNMEGRDDTTRMDLSYRIQCLRMT